MPDDGRDAHDTTIIKTTRGQAIAKMRGKGVEIDQEEEKMALQLFPRVSLIISDICFKIKIN